jgi:hypothetical protein
LFRRIPGDAESAAIFQASAKKETSSAAANESHAVAFTLRAA